MTDYLEITKGNVPHDEQMSVWVDGKPRLVPDLQHHLSRLALKRNPSPLKALAKYWLDPNMIMLAGGMPHPDFFPYDSLSAKVLPHDAYTATTPGMGSSSTVSAQSSNSQPLSWIWRLLGYGGGLAPKTEDISVPKYNSAGRSANQLSVSLQYGTATGIDPLQQFVTEFSRKVFKPYLPNTATLITTGNTDGWNRIVQTLINPGEFILVEEWTYPSALSTARPFDAAFVPVAMDGEGLRADALESILENWNEEERGGQKRPHVMYIVPIGQNPSGATMGAARKKDVYEICVKYDVIICEDDPYYFLQEGPYVPKSYRSRKGVDMDPEEWVETLSPSFLKFDYEGRVIRMDTFSKTIAPGSRIGWFTCSPMFADRLLRVGETSTQAPSGFGQSMVAELIANHWGYNKYVRWLQGLQKCYSNRRDELVDAIAKEFDLSEETAEPTFFSGAKMLAAKERLPAWTPYATYGDEKKRRGTWFSFIPPTSGMFVWVRVHLENHPAYSQQSRSSDPTEHLEARLFIMLAEHKLLIGPGWFFSSKLEDAPVINPSDPAVLGLLRGRSSTIDAPNGDPADHDPAQYAHFRIAFSSATAEQFQTAMHIFSHVLKQFFNETK
ncbi:hypothetical protein FRB94_001666 [Tulasnella sp. JGI-2019a]|nr:hypothetical protein FRB94_001666 [Tulasnella sp. JGI-2019a]